MFKNVPNLKLYVSVFIVVLNFIQAYNWWAEGRVIVSLFFAIPGLLIVFLLVTILYKRKQSEEENN